MCPFRFQLGTFKRTPIGIHYKKSALQPFCINDTVDKVSAHVKRTGSFFVSSPESSEPVRLSMPSKPVRVA